MDVNVKKLIDFLNENGYEIEYIQHANIIKINNLDLEMYDNIQYIGIFYDEIYYDGRIENYNLEEIFHIYPRIYVMEIGINDGHCNMDNYGFDDHFDISDYRNTIFDGIDIDYHFLSKVLKSTNELITELSKFNKKGEYIKG